MTELEPLALLHERPGPELPLGSELRRLYGGDLGLGDRCLYANFVETVDGVVAIPSLPGSNALIARGSAADRFSMGLLRASADAVLIGSGTLRASPQGRWRPETVYPPAAELYANLRRELGLPARNRVVIVTATGSIPVDHAVLADAPIVLTTEAGAARIEAALSAEVDVSAVPGDGAGGVDVGAAVQLLRERGLDRILSEAGPHVFGALLDADVVDDLFVTLSPLLAGRGPAEALGLVEGVAFLADRPREARLGSVRVHGDHAFLHYRLHRTPKGREPRTAV